MSQNPPDPIVACVMLVNGREAMVKRAIASYRAQTYGPRQLLIFDTTPEGIMLSLRHSERQMCRSYQGDRESPSIGFLRNEANALVAGADLIAHWDSDDWSHRKRLEEQVRLIQSSGRDAVGYQDALFWDTRPTARRNHVSGVMEGPLGSHPVFRFAAGEAWLYDSINPFRYIGASMMYRRSVWESCPFHPTEPHEDYLWWSANQRRSAAAHSINPSDPAPRMICGIHDNNTSPAYDQEHRKGPHWRRIESWDQHCEEVMQL